jgi:multicomponent Na+:H+ antiporter subunit E
MNRRAFSWINYLYTFILVWLIWFAFTTSFNAVEWLVGGLISAIIAYITVRFYDCCSPVLLAPGHILYFFQYFFVFVKALIRANLDVAKRVIRPDLPINPGIVMFQTRLTDPFAKMVLANSITLTPGTLTVDVIGDRFYIHWIDVEADDPAEVYKIIAEPFEKILLKIYK